AGGAGALGFLIKKQQADPVEAALLAGSLLLSLLALETKEIAGTIPGAIILWELLFMWPREGTWQERLRHHSAPPPHAFMVALLPFLAVRMDLDPRFLFKEDVQNVSDVQKITGGQYFLTELNVLSTYVRLYLLPVGQSIDYDYPKAESLFEKTTFLSLLALV